MKEQIRKNFFYLLILLSLAASSYAVFLALKAQASTLYIEVDKLSTELKQMKQLNYDIKNLEKDISSIKRALRSKKSSQTAIRSIEKIDVDNSYLDDPFLGQKKAPVLLMTFGNYESAKCKQFVTETLPLLKSEFIDTGKLMFVFRDYPLKTNIYAEEAAKAANCIGQQGHYWEMFDALFASKEPLSQEIIENSAKTLKSIKQDKFKKCVSSTRHKKEIEKDIDDAKRLGAKGVPAFFVGTIDSHNQYQGVLIRGAQPYAVIKAEILYALKQNESSQ